MPVEPAAFQTGHSSTCMCYCCFSFWRRLIEKLRRHTEIWLKAENGGQQVWVLCMKAAGLLFVPQAWSSLPCPASALEASALERRAVTVHCFPRGRHLQIFEEQQPACKYELAEKLRNLWHTIRAPVLVPQKLPEFNSWWESFRMDHKERYERSEKQKGCKIT